MSEKPNPTIDQMLARLIDEFLRGRTALSIATGLTAADPAVIQTAPVFFGLTHDGLLELSQMYAAKLYDTHRGTITVEFLLTESEQHHKLFKNGQPDEVLDAVSKCRTQIASLAAPLASIKERRNKALAHLDPDFVADPQALNKTAILTIEDLKSVFDETERVLRKIDTLYSGPSGELKYLGQNDYEMALELIADAKCAEAAQYEKLYGEPCTWQLPKKYSPRKLDSSRE
jgi:hypothetical protein